MSLFCRWPVLIYLGRCYFDIHLEVSETAHKIWMCLVNSLIVNKMLFNVIVKHASAPKMFYKTHYFFMTTLANWVGSSLTSIIRLTDFPIFARIMQIRRIIHLHMESFSRRTG